MDFSDDSVLHSYLIANEVNLQGYEREELVALAKSLAESNGESFFLSEFHETVEEVPSMDASDIFIPAVPPSPPHRTDMGVGILSSSSSSSSSEQQLHEVNTNNNIIEDNINIGDNNELISEQDEKIQQFCGITNSESSYARSLLESTDWNLELAISLAMDMGMGAMSPSPPRVPVSAPLSTTSSVNTSNIQPMPGLPGMSLLGMENTMNHYETNFPDMPIPPITIPSNIDSSVEAISSGISNVNVNGGDSEEGTQPPSQSHINDFFQPSSIGGSGYNGLNNSNIAARTRSSQYNSSQRQARRDEYDENGIRFADNSYQDRLLDGYGDDRNGLGNIRSRGSTNSLGGTDGQAQDDPLARAEDSSVQWIVPPPSHLSYPCGWNETRSHAKLDKKWILVNIQLHTNFQSHELNSYTWSDETVESLIRENFVFWQRGSTSPDAQGFVNMYRIREDQMPYICIIDARTGAQMLTCKGFLGPQKFAMEIFDFMDYHSSGGGHKIKHLDCSKERAVTYDSTPGADDEDEDDDDEDYQYESDNDGNSGSFKGKNPFSPLSDDPDEGVDIEIASPTILPASAPAPISTIETINEQNKGVGTDNITSSSSSASSVATTSIQTELDIEAHDEVKKEVVNYGIVPDEPTTGGCRIKLSLANSSSGNGKVTIIKRKFNSDDPVRTLFAVAKAGIIEREKNDTSNNKDSIGDSSSSSDINRNFDLYTTFPRKQLSLLLDQSLKEAQLENAQVLMQWEEED